MAQDVDLNLLRLETLAREVRPARASHRAWAVIHPFLYDARGERKGSLRIRARVVDVPTRELELRGGDLDGDEPFLVDRVDVVVDDVGQAWEVLRSAGVECDGFVPPFQCGLPF